MDSNKFAKIHDKISVSDPGSVRFSGLFDRVLGSFAEGLFLRLDPLAVTSYFRERTDPFAAGEFFGKILRAAANVCAYTGDPKLKQYIDRLAELILDTRDEAGIISTVPSEKQPNGSNGSDLWERKYVLLGLWEYYRNFGATLRRENDVLEAMLDEAAGTAGQIGDESEGKLPVTKTGWAFCGIESSSILEPVMKLYLLSGDGRLKRLADHIVASGACARENLFRSIKSGKAPYLIGCTGDPKESIAKSYEMMSCFEGLLEYYRATGEQEYLDCCRVFIDAINEDEITYLGSGGAVGPFNLGPGTGEQWNKSRFTQWEPDVWPSMETCVTVTYMKLMLQWYRLTGDASSVDRIETAAYNALLGAMKRDGSYFEYFPRFDGVRSTKSNFTYDVSGVPLSCCTANGPMGFAILPGLAVCESQKDVQESAQKDVIVNLYAPLTAKLSGGTILEILTDYPRTGVIKLVVRKAGDLSGNILLRIPEFCEDYDLSGPFTEKDGYAALEGPFADGDEFTLTLRYEVAVHAAPVEQDVLKALAEYTGKTPDHSKVLLTYGPLVLSRDKSLDPNFSTLTRLSPDDLAGLELSAGPEPSAGGSDEGSVTTEGSFAAEGSFIAEGSFTTEDSFAIKNDRVTLVPYYAAGASWDGETEFRSWHCFDF
ncbi:MAG: glycoside hydrolase family 127 protein [Clostridia bacterium]|nr:glycoside hydrolase family 127 protein [Clostridia bacterium]